MKCPNVNCDHDFDLDLFGTVQQDIIIECPKCHKKVEAFWDYQLTEDDEYPYIDELNIVEEEKPK